jgi:hypothetical protein
MQTWVFKSTDINDYVEFLKWNEEKCTPIYELRNKLVSMI